MEGRVADILLERQSADHLKDISFLLRRDGIVCSADFEPLQLFRKCRPLAAPKDEWQLMGLPEGWDYETLFLTREEGAWLAGLIQFSKESNSNLYEVCGWKPVSDSFNDRKLEVPLVLFSSKLWERPAVPPTGWEVIGEWETCGLSDIDEEEIEKWPTEERLNVGHATVEFMKEIMVADTAAEEDCRKNDLKDWRENGGNAEKCSPPLTPILREQTPFSFELPPPERFDTPGGLLHELEGQLLREETANISLLSSPVSDLARDYLQKKDSSSPAYNFVNPDFARISSPLLPLECSTFSQPSVKILLRPPQLPCSPPPTSPSNGVFRDTQMSDFALKFEQELAQEELFQEDLTVRVHVPALPFPSPSSIQNSLFANGTWKATMGLAAKKYTGEQTIGKYSLKWAPFNFITELAEIGIEGEFSENLTFTEEEMRRAENDVHNCVDGLLTYEGNPDDDILEFQVLAAGLSWHSDGQYTELDSHKRAREQKDSQEATAEASVWSGLKDMSSAIRASSEDPAAELNRLESVFPSRKRKLDTTIQPLTGEFSAGRDLNSFLLIRGRETYALSDSSISNAANVTEPAREQSTEPVRLYYLPATPLPFQAKITLPNPSHPTTPLISLLLSKLNPIPSVITSPVEHPGITPTILLSPTTALVLTHYRRLTQSSLLPGEKPMPGMEINPFRKEITEIVATGEFERLIILLEVDFMPSRALDEFRFWCAGMEEVAVEVVGCVKEEMVVQLGKTVRKYGVPVDKW